MTSLSMISGVVQVSKLTYNALLRPCALNLPRMIGTSKALASSPKRPVNQYMQFYLEKHQELASNNPGVSTTGKGRMLGEIWRTMSAEEKQPFIQRYQKAVAEYNAYLDQMSPEDRENLLSEKKEKMKLLKQKRDKKKLKADHPKRPPSAYVLYFKHIYPNLDGKTFAERGKQGSQMWHNLSEQEKMVYKTERDALWADYQQQVAGWKSKKQESTAIKQTPPPSKKGSKTSKSTQTQPDDLSWMREE